MKLNGNLDLLKLGQLKWAIIEKDATIDALAQLGYDTTALRAKIYDGVSAKKLLQENDINTDNTLWGSMASDTVFSSQKAVKDYVDGVVTSAFHIKWDLNCSTNPNYPAAVAGDAYVVTADGKIGGAAWVVVNAGDLIVAKADNAWGTQAAVWADWFILEANREQATESLMWVLKIATDTDLVTGTDDTNAITSVKLKTFLALAWAAAKVGYDGTTSGLMATTVQAAIDELVVRQTGAGFIIENVALTAWATNTIAHGQPLVQGIATVRDYTTKNAFRPDEIAVDATNVSIDVLQNVTVDILVTRID